MNLLTRITAAIIVVGLVGWQTPAQAASGNAKDVKRAARAYINLCDHQMARERAALQLTSQKTLAQQKKEHRRQLRAMKKQQTAARKHLSGSEHTTQRRALMKQQRKEYTAAQRRFAEIERRARAEAKQQIARTRDAHKAKKKQVRQLAKAAMARGIIIPKGGGVTISKFGQTRLTFPACSLPK